MDGGSALPSGTAQPALPLAEALGRCNPDQRAPSPALAKEDVLYATRPKPPAQLIRATRSHTVKLMPPAYVKAYVKRNKNDAADAEAICEAVTRPSMRFVPVEDVEQQSVLMLHRARAVFWSGNARCSSMHCGLTWPNSASLRRRVCGMSRS
jgi:hypothetical protein